MLYVPPLSLADEQWLHGDGPDLAVDVQYDDSLSKPVSLAHHDDSIS